MAADNDELWLLMGKASEAVSVVLSHLPGIVGLSPFGNLADEVSKAMKAIAEFNEAVCRGR